MDSQSLAELDTDEYNSDDDDFMSNDQRSYSPHDHILSSAFRKSKRERKIRLTEDEKIAMMDSCWYKFAEVITSAPFNVLIVIGILALCGFFCIDAMSLNITSDIKAGVPKSVEALTVLLQVQKAFGLGYISPFFILMNANTTSSDTQSVLTNNFHDAQVGIFQDISSSKLSTMIDTTDSVSVFHVNGSDLSILEVEALLLLDATYRFTYNQVTNTAGTSSVIKLTPSFDPNTNEANDAITNLRSLIESYNAKYNGKIQFYLAGPRVYELDTINRAVGNAMKEIAITTAFVFTLMALFLKSFWTPVRLAFTLLAPLTCVYGIAVAVYQYGKMPFESLFSFLFLFVFCC
jgi:uncharacterized membrane protein YdfJ with MMPL/SSD domain